MEGLLAALIEERMGALDQARQKALTAMEVATPETDRSIRDYVGVLILPLALHTQKNVDRNFKLRLNTGRSRMQ